MGKNRRKSVRVAPVQKTLTTRIVMYLLIFLCVTAVVDLAMQVLSDPLQPWSVHWDTFLQRQRLHGLVLLCLLPILIRDCLRFSHRFAGPVVRFQGVLRDLNDHHPVAPVQLRRGDYWTDFAGELNTTIRLIARLRSETNAVETSAGNGDTLDSTVDFDASAAKPTDMTRTMG